MVHPETDHRRAIAGVGKWPKLEKALATHAPVGAVFERRFMVDDFIRFCVVTQHQPEVLGRLGLLVEVRTYDGRNAVQQIGVQLPEQVFDPRTPVARRYRIPDGARVETDALERDLQLAGSGSPAERRIEPGEVEHLVL